MPQIVGLAAQFGVEADVLVDAADLGGKRLQKLLILVGELGQAELAGGANPAIDVRQGTDRRRDKRFDRRILARHQD
ncbi:MAG TPA: hypothetical protein VK362_17560, partial [Reyranella sp.]|nr:hypothetical protein [Reyranella sp.]